MCSDLDFSAPSNPIPPMQQPAPAMNLLDGLNALSPTTMPSQPAVPDLMGGSLINNIGKYYWTSQQPPLVTPYPKPLHVVCHHSMLVMPYKFE